MAAERMSGSDAVLWHMEDSLTPLHTLKIVILDTERRGRPVTLDELALAVGARLGLMPRATQKVVAAPGFGGRPFWVDDPAFELSSHLDERHLPLPGGQRELDALYAELAEAMLPRDRALWAMTLVHGLEGGRQAVVVRIHHAVVDGLGSLNAFIAASSSECGVAVDLIPASTAESTTRRRLFAAATRDTVRTWRRSPALVRKALAARRRSREYRAATIDLPKPMTTHRTSLNEGPTGARACASGSLDLATLRAIGKVSGTTINGVLHAVIAGAIRAELLDRNDDISKPCIGSFGISPDTSDSERRHGNVVTPTFVELRCDLKDPVARLDATARSCRAGVELRRHAGLDLTDPMSALAPRGLNAVRRVLSRHTKMTPGHVVTANVPGAKSPRWFGDIEVVDWFSFAIAVNPASVNLTAHSYAGRMNIGIVCDPAAMPDPSRFIGRLHDELDVLAGAILVAGTTASVAS